MQQWFQAVITHPGGVAAGVAAPAAQQLVRLDRGSLEALVRRSRRLSAEERLSIYANAYYARLLECLGDCFPVLRGLLGGEVFDGFAFDYLQAHPSRSYTLTKLAESFPRFLAATRPARGGGEGGAAAAPAGAVGGAAAGGQMDGSDTVPGEPAVAAPPARPDAAPEEAAAPDWADLLIDLATLELAVAEVFDGPGAEGEPLPAAATLPAAAEFAAARLEPVPCLRLLTFRFPLNALYTAARALLAARGEEAGGAGRSSQASEETAGRATDPGSGEGEAVGAGDTSRGEGAAGTGAGEALGSRGSEESSWAGEPLLPLLEIPAPAVEHLALSRSDFVVRRHVLSPLEHAVLSALLGGASVGEAIAAIPASAASTASAAGRAIATDAGTAASAGAAEADATATPLSDDALAAELHAAFRRWMAAGFFRRAVTS